VFDNGDAGNATVRKSVPRADRLTLPRVRDAVHAAARRRELERFGDVDSDYARSPART
jgi:hypothetical protein